MGFKKIKILYFVSLDKKNFLLFNFAKTDKTVKA